MSETVPASAAAPTGEGRSGLRAVVLSGGLNFEREVSLSSGTQVVEELARAGLDAEIRDADADLLPGLAASPADAVFIALHGATGEDGALRAVLDLAGVPYVGSPAAACRLAWDKPAAKSVVRAVGATTPDWVALPHSTFRELGAGAVLDLMVARLGLPLIVKPASGGSALGVQKVSSVEELPAAMVSCFAYGDTVMVERYIDGIELAISVVDLGEGPQALPAVEIVPASGGLRLHRPLLSRTDRVPRTGPGARRRGGARSRAGDPGAPGTRAGRPVPHRRDRLPGRRGAVPRGERLAGAHGDLHVSHGAGGGRLRPG
jgi:D-alanine-D-alanine ligase